MKDRLIKGLFLVMGILLLVLPIATVYGDAGHNSSYSSGGSHSSGGSRSSGGSSYHSSSRSRSSSSSSSSSGSGSSAAVVLFIVIFVIVLIIILSSGKKSGSGKITNQSTNYYSMKLLTQEEIEQLDSTIDGEALTQQVFNMFVDEQMAWMNFDYEGLRKLLSDELYNNYKMQLETMEIGMEKNIMDDIVFVDGGIISIKKTDLTEEVQVKMHVRMRDYIINTADGKPKHGDPNKVMDNNYIITLERSRRKEIQFCPNCGGELTSKASQKCKYCDAVLVKGSKEFVIVKQENVKGQYH